MYAQPGYASNGSAILKVLDETGGFATVAEFELRYLRDSHEVALVKKVGEEWEAVYTELLPAKLPA
jgi:hypothetical protein